MDYNPLSRQNVAYGSQAQQAAYDQGLRSYMLQIYNYMAIALALTGGIAYFTAATPALLQAIYGTPLQYVVMFAPIGVVLFLSMRIQHLSFSAAQAWFWAYAALNGLALAWIFIAYTGHSVASAFFVTAGAFASLSLFGYTTKKDLSGMATFLFMGLIGLLIASLVNIFMQSSAIQFAISVMGVLVFAGLTAYDTQSLKRTYYAIGGTGEQAGKTAIIGALKLYLDFINLFIMLLSLFGNRR